MPVYGPSGFTLGGGASAVGSAGRFARVGRAIRTGAAWLGRGLINPYVQFFGSLAMSAFLVAWAPDIAQNTVVPMFVYILTIAGKILDFVLKPDFNGLPLTSGGIVDIGWQITRDAMNMFFVLWMVIISFGTILGVDEFGWKKNFVRLLMVAVLVNFTKVIAGVIVDMGQILINFFVYSGLREQGVLALVQNLNIHQLFTTSTGFFSAIFGGAYLNVVENYIQKVAIVTLEISFISVAATLFLQIALLFITRVVALWMLVILAPVAFVMGIMPFGFSRGLIGRWFGQIFAWSFMGVVMMFFMYLAAQLSAVLAGAGGDSALGKVYTSGRDPDIGSLFSGSQFFGTFSPILVFLTVYLFLHFGYSMAQSTGAIGANIATGFGQRIASGVGNFIKGIIGGVAGGIAGYLGRTMRSGAMATGIPKKTVEFLERNATLMRLPFAQTAVSKIREGFKASEESVKRMEHRFKQMSGEAINTILPTLNWEERIAAINAAISNGDLEKLTRLNPEDLKIAYQRAENIKPGMGLKIGMVSPTTIFKDESEMIKFISKNRGMAHYIDPSQLVHASVAAALGPQGVRNIIQKGNLKQIENIAKGVENLNKPGAPLDRFAATLEVSENRLKNLAQASQQMINNVDKWAYEGPTKEKEYKEEKKEKK